MAYDVRAERAAPRPLAAIRATIARRELGAGIIRQLDVIWPMLRDQQVRTGHNVVIYHGGDDETVTADVGVEAFTEFAGRGEVRPVSTPAGEVATTAHYGEYSQLGGAYEALEQWCRDHGRPRAGVSWEVYGDWDDDPAKRRTDLFFLLEPATG